jgi:hypothetical protein
VAFVAVRSAEVKDVGFWFDHAHRGFVEGIKDCGHNLFSRLSGTDIPEFSSL